MQPDTAASFPSEQECILLLAENSWNYSGSRRLGPKSGETKGFTQQKTQRSKAAQESERGWAAFGRFHGHDAQTGKSQRKGPAAL